MDDDRLVRESLVRWLAQARFVVIQANNGVAGLNAVRASQLDLVISDVQMPKVDGPQLLAAIRRERPQLPVILMSGSQGVCSAEQARSFGACAFLQKPLDLQELSRAVHSSIRAD